MINHVKREASILQKDGDIDAVIVPIDDTGDSGAAIDERYRHVIQHNLGRVPVACYIVKKNAACDVWVLSSDDAKITVRFDVAHVKLTLRIF